MIKRYVYWNSRVFEIPYYINLFFGCLFKGISPLGLLKANYGLEHGDIGIGSKYSIQMSFKQDLFPSTELLKAGEVNKEQRVDDFIQRCGTPVILKSDQGEGGRGLVLVRNISEFRKIEKRLYGDFIIQEYVDYPFEFGVFYVRKKAGSIISGISQKHSPILYGDGLNTFRMLINNHPNYTKHWHSFLRYHDLDRVPAKGEKIELSFIGSHTLGCISTDETHLATGKIKEKLDDLFKHNKGFNFGRLDVKAKSIEDFQKGEFKILEVNGITSIPTHIYDPQYSVWKAYRIFLQHGRLLLTVAGENRNKAMRIYPFWRVARLIRQHKRAIERAHEQLLERI